MVAQVWDSERIYYSNLFPQCSECIEKDCDTDCMELCKIYDEDCRFKKGLAHGAEVFLCEKVSDIKNRKRFQERYSLLVANIPFFKSLVKDAFKRAADIERERYSQVVHNLKSLNAQNLMIQYTFIPQEENDRYRDLFSKVEENVRENPKEATLTLLKLAKNNAHMKTEFSTHEKLTLEEPMLFKQQHQVKSVILNVYHSFDIDFKDKDIRLVISESQARAYFDYETIRVSLYHIFFNAIKYMRSHSTLNIGISERENDVTIDFFMESLHIFPEETEKIFEEHYSGRIPVANGLAGKGLGMGLIRKAVLLNNGQFEIVPGKSSKKIEGKLFSENQFRVILPKN